MTLAQPRTLLTAELRSAAAPPGRPAWETELFVLSAGDRDGLRQHVGSLTAFLSRHPDVVLSDLAYTLNTELAPDDSRLAIVAGSLTELQARLARAGERLSDPRCHQIRETQGLYYFDEPMYPQGKLAVLFTGEGAQYLGMLADLIAEFPEARAHFTVSDRISLAAGQRCEPISRVFHLPSELSAQERAAAEKALWEIDNAVGAVLVSNWALYGVLCALGVRADVFGGHSAGEISALAGAGCVAADDALFCELFALSKVLRDLEADGSSANTALLAVGTGRKVVLELIEQTGVAVHLAMDNCPHQTVLGGPQDAVAVVESQLRARGIVCERLPFQRPYHTPLFEPFLGPIAAMYERLRLRAPQKPVYSCVTAQPFPADPADIRQLSVAHWAGRVEFAGLIQAMYADGVRVFVESGPRGNLTAFVEDILRGRSFAAVAADLPRRKGLTQLNHVAGQLAAHHVPLELGYLYRARDVRRVSWRTSVPEERKAPIAARGPAPETRTAPPAPPVVYPRSSSRAEVLSHYCQVMETFLDVQRSVTEEFLRARGRAGIQAPPSPAPDPVDLRARWPLLGEVICHEAGLSAILQRRIDLKEDLYALDHTLGGRYASRVDPSHHGLAVMPMAISVEMMAEAAAFLVPGKVLIGLERVRLHRWIALDADDPITLEVTVRLQQAGNLVRVRAEIRNFGNALGLGRAEAPVVDGTVLMADRFPEPPPVEPFRLTAEGPCRYTPSQLYEGERRVFHGPLFQAVCSTDRQGKEGIEGGLRTLPHDRLFRSAPAPELLTDPLLIDASTHLLGCWHLGQPDQTGRVVFPYELGRLTLYGPRPTYGSRVGCRVRVLKETARQASHCIELIGPDGRYWCRIEPAEYWRFYWPEEYTSYFRFKEQARVSHDWPLALSEAKAAGSRAAAAARCLRVVPPKDLQQTVTRAAIAHVCLSRAEWQQFRVLKGSEETITDWAFGRVIAKDAIRVLWEERHGEKLLPADFELVMDPEGRWQARRLDRLPSSSLSPGERGARSEGAEPLFLGGPGDFVTGSNSDALPSVSFACAEGVMAALASFEARPGIDLARVQRREASFVDLAFDPGERALLDRVGAGQDEWVTRFWCARTAAARALGRRLVDGPQHLAVRSADPRTGKVGVALDARLAETFPELCGNLLITWTARDGDLVVATTLAETEAL